MEKRSVNIGGVVLGGGRTAVCIPVMGRDEAALAASAQQAAQAGADVLELRADSAAAMPDVQQAVRMCQAVRRAAPGHALLFTLRTQRDGGQGDADCGAYEALLNGLLEKNPCPADAVDVELSVGEAALTRIARKAHDAGVCVVGSWHDFGRTPPETEICEKLARMACCGADVCKAAVMPNSKLDVMELMRAAVRSDETLSQPVIAISMGAPGMITRICAEMMGSCMTFASAGQASAPGQMDASALRRAMESIRRCL